MTPNDIQQELHDQLADHGLRADQLGTDLAAHKRRRDAAIESATATMSMRVQRAMNAHRQTGRPHVTRFTLAMTAVAATVVIVVTNRPGTSVSTDIPDSTTVVTTSARTIERDVDALTDELVRRSSTTASGWSVTEADVDQLLGDAGLDL